MRKTILIITVIAISGMISSCDKDKTAGLITFTSLTPNSFADTSQAVPVLKFHITNGQWADTIFLQEPLSNTLDSLPFPPDLVIAGNNFNGDVSATFDISFLHKDTTSIMIPRTDTIHYNVYVKDTHGNKSNVFTTTPIYYTITH